MQKQNQIHILVVLLLFLFIINYPFLNQLTEDFLDNSRIVKVDRVIDGDTIEFNKTSVRLLGINTPERGEKFYTEAKEFLEDKVLDKTVTLVSGREEKDRYGRLLAYIYLNGKNVNLEIVEQGYGNFYFPSGKDNKYNQFKEAWDYCIENEKNLCERSRDVCASCIELKEFDYKNDEIIFRNSCDFSCNLRDWELKDEGRKKFIFPEFILKPSSEVKVIVGDGFNDNKVLYWKNENYVFTTTGDTMFFRDSDGKLVLFSNF
jgi:endonuclease YncB( thermonuclease family)